MQSITEFTQGRYDAADTVVTIDGIRPKLYTDGNIYQLSYAEDHISTTADVYGNGIAVINHNDKATLTISLSRLDETWQTLLSDQNNFRDAAHKITINAPTETITTDSAYIAKLPDMSGGKDVPNVDLAFTCIKATVTKKQ